VKEMWDQKYGDDHYFYGTEPNVFLMQQADLIPAGGRVLVTGDGEGRNGVWLAEQGFLVTSVDYSTSGIKKASKLARQRQVTVDLAQADLTTWDWPEATFDAVVTVFLHFLPEDRRRVHAGINKALKPGGRLIVELFHPRQLDYCSGGPKNVDMLVTAEDLRADFPNLQWEQLEEVEVKLDEGLGHQGPGMVSHGVGLKQR